MIKDKNSKYWTTIAVLSPFILFLISDTNLDSIYFSTVIAIFILILPIILGVLFEWRWMYRLMIFLNICLWVIAWIYLISSLLGFGYKGLFFSLYSLVLIYFFRLNIRNIKNVRENLNTK